MRLLFALPGFHRYDRGAEVALLSVAEELARLGHAVTVAGSGPARPGASYAYRRVSSVRRERFEKYPFFPPLRSETAWEDMTFAANLLRAYRPADFDAVITCSFPFTHWALRRPANASPLQIFVTQNGDWPAYADNSEYRTFWCDGLVCTNPDYFERNSARWSCTVIPNGVDLGRFHTGADERERLGLPTDKPIVLMVSALIPTKRVEDGIKALSRMDGAHLVVAGDGPLRSDAEAMAANLLPGRYRRISLPATEMPALYRSADAFLHLSLLESFGNVFLEAWASGLPIVGHDTERLRWILADNSAFLCDTEDEGALGRSLTGAVAAGRQRNGVAHGIDRFAWPNVAMQYQQFIESLLQSR
ncbi:glycosyl transferase family 1 [Sphingopyxis sp. H050]|jgi:glycosyltransferase involved in cell wall biosynthesis|uniref:glycosyltransferase family 4 protein n=1 Tax=Sphingopyxis sp. H050 TaxID=1759072 RepID=UPI00073684CB|nr:glycosyltransferase family 4 protein [Sphingopyxis sp. H050]KTE18987.1 glycosyl transferase family 1 [Sphingopyxis sp. H050]